MDLGRTPTEIAGHAEVGDRQVLDVLVQVSGEQPVEPPAAQQRHDGERVVAEGLAADEGLANHFDGRAGIERSRHGNAHHRADAGTADPVNRDAGFVQRAIDAKVGETAGGATAEHDAERLPGQHARQSLQVIGDARAQVQVIVEPPLAQPARGARQQCRAAVMGKQQRTPRRRFPCVAEQRLFPGTRRRIAARRRGQQDLVGMTQRQP